MRDTVTIRFVLHDAPFDVGDRLECTPAVAEKLVGQGVAKIAMADPHPLAEALPVASKATKKG